MKKLTRTEIKDKIDEGIKLALSTGERVIIDYADGVCDIMFKKGDSYVGSYHLTGLDSTCVSVPDSPDTTGILISFKPTTFRIFG